MDVLAIPPGYMDSEQSHLDRWLDDQQQHSAWNVNTAVSVVYTQQRHERHHFVSEMKRTVSTPALNQRPRSPVRTSSAEIPIFVGGVQKWITGLNRRTTCDDVIYAILQGKGKENIKLTDYIIWEQWRDVERPLRGRTKILKVWRAWGAENSNVQFYLRKLESPLEAWRKMKASRKHKKLALKPRNELPQTPRHSEPACDSKPPLPPRKKSKETENEKEQKSWAYNHLVQIILDQERLIREQSARIFRTDNEIEDHESRIHQLRIEANGVDYVQDAYMESKPNDAERDQVNAHFQRLVDIEEKIEQEEAKISRLSSEVVEEGFVVEPPDVSFSHCCDNDSINVDWDYEVEVDDLRAKLSDCVQMGDNQKMRIEEMNNALHGYDTELAKKRAHVESLEIQLAEEVMEQDHQLLPPLMTPPSAEQPKKAPVAVKNCELKISKAKNTGNSYSDSERIKNSPETVNKPKFFDSLTSLDEEGSLESSGSSGLGSMNSEEAAMPVLETLV